MAALDDLYPTIPHQRCAFYHNLRYKLLNDPPCQQCSTISSECIPHVSCIINLLG